MQTFIKLLIYYSFIALPLQVFGQYSVQVIDSSQAACSFRGLSVVNDQVVWVSGSKGTVGLSTNGGKSWEWTQVPGFEKSDFRDIEAFDAKRAVIMASGTPAVILKTTDGGKNWKLVFRDDRPEMFLDAMDFWDNKHGMMVGDPVNGHFVILETTDGGSSWKQWDTAHTPAALDSEAVFAASGTSLRCWGKEDFGFVTGGKYCRLIKGVLSREIIIHPYLLNEMLHGKPSQGAFSLIKWNDNYLTIAGGDYVCDTCTISTLSGFDLDSLKSRTSVLKLGYISGGEFIGDCLNGIEINMILTGSAFTQIIGFKYGCFGGHNVSDRLHIGFNVVRKSKAKKGKAVFLAGGKGRIGKLVKKERS